MWAVGEQRGGGVGGGGHDVDHQHYGDQGAAGQDSVEIFTQFGKVQCQ